MANSINLHRLDLPSLRLVFECARGGSLSVAARACHMSISAASHRLQRLEQAFGTPLFRRHRRGLDATEAGDRVARASEAVLDALDAMSGDVQELKTSASRHVNAAMRHFA